MIRAVHVGRVDPATMHWGYDVAREEDRRDGRGCARCAQGKGLGAALDALEPPVSHYARAQADARRLQGARQGRRAGAGAGAAEGQTKVEPGKAWAGVPQLAARLRAFGDLAGRRGGHRHAPTTRPLVDGGEALPGTARPRGRRRHRRRHDQGAQRAAGAARAADRAGDGADALAAGAERSRRTSSSTSRSSGCGPPIPTTGDEPLRMNVVVGKSLNHQTPIFVEQMEYVIFRPYWNPPHGITVKEIIPHARRDPCYMARENLEIVASGADDAPALPPTPENLAAVRVGQAVPAAEAGPAELARPRQVHLSRTTRTSTCTARRRSSCSRARAATSATAASASRIRRASPSGCCATSPEWTRERDRRGDAGRAADAGQPQAAAHGRALLRHRARQLRGRRVLRRTTSTATTGARRGAGAGLSVPDEELRRIWPSAAPHPDSLDARMNVATACRGLVAFVALVRIQT